jgi:Uncharacterized protein conserved in bacteria
MANLWEKFKDFVSGADYEDDYDDEYEDEYEEDYEEAAPPIRSYRTAGASSSARTSTRTVTPRPVSPIRSTSSSSASSSFRNTISLQQMARGNSSRSSKVMNISTNVNMQVIVATPKTIEEAGELCAHLKERKTIIVNLENVEHGTAQRISDFLCGANYALDGTIQLISGEIFVICPIDVEISSQLKEDLKANALQLTYSR